jgi:hypothetical protein
MAFSATEITNIANAALDFYIKGPAFAQTIQSRPLLDHYMRRQKTFPGGKGSIDLPVKGDYTTAIAGYTHNDTVSYANPANLKRVNFPWKEIHAGITVTLSELKRDGITVVDSLNGAKTSEHSNIEMTRLVGLLEDKLDDMAEGWARTFNNMLWRDGTQDAKLVAGLTAFIADDPTTGTLGGLSRATTVDSKGFYYWRNRALVGGNTITASPSGQTLTKALRREVRQLTRFGGKPTVLLCGSKFIEALESEVHEKGYYTLEGFKSEGKTDIGMAKISLRGLGTFEYDPTLDDLQAITGSAVDYSKRCYMIDSDAIQLYVMEGEDRKTHTPARPYDQYTLYRAMTWTGGTVARQLNSSGVYAVA